jgi:hypothetical protein
MPRKLRIEYPGAMYHLMSRGDRRERIFLDDVDRQDFLMEKGGDYLLQIKGNQKRLFNQAQRFDALQDTPFLSSPKPDTDESKPVPCTPSPSNP